MADFPEWEPPFNGSEAEHLAGSLDRMRATFRWKADGLDRDQLLRRAVPTSALSLGALLKHLAVCEDSVFAWRTQGQRLEALASMPEGAEVDEWQFQVDDLGAEQLYAMYDEAVARSRRRMAEFVEQGRLDEPGHLTYGDIQPSIRRHVYDLLEEYARHTGHADLIREALDGRVGEDPPQDWEPFLSLD